MNHINNYFNKFLIVMLITTYLTFPLSAGENNAYQFHIKTSANSLMFEVKDSSALISPVVDLLIQTADDRQLLWEGKRN